MSKNIFFSIGTPSGPQQQKIFHLVRSALEKRGMIAKQPEWSYKKPLVNIRDTLNECVGMIVVAYPRTLITLGKDHPGAPKEQSIEDVLLTTPWNHIEAAFAYDRGLPLMVIKDMVLRPEGFLDQDYDWAVQSVVLDEAFLTGTAFNSMLDGFSSQVDDYISGSYTRFPDTIRHSKDKPSAELKTTPTPQGQVEEIKSVGALISRLSLEVVLQVGAIIAALVSSAFWAGQYFLK